LYRTEDAIDFPCSPDWVRHYAGLGLTRDYPQEYYWGMRIAELREQVEAQARQIEELAAEIEAMKARHAGRYRG